MDDTWLIGGVWVIVLREDFGSGRNGLYRITMVVWGSLLPALASMDDVLEAFIVWKANWPVFLGR